MKQYRLKSTGEIIDIKDIEEITIEPKEFLTVDGISVGKNTDVFAVDINFKIYNTVGRDIELCIEDKFFSTKQTAEQYCMDNQALLSVKDMIDVLGINNESIKKDDKVILMFNKLKQLANSKFLQIL